ncbi:MAG TPA: 30S ribosomal protein S6 [Polyangiaceae bacterium]|nr:30S ribosomal protein S6 [Polyangiaceae bacterium]
MAEASSATTSPHKAREYETIYVLKPTVTRETQEKIASRLEEVVGRGNGKLTQVDNWGRRQLAYPVAKHRRGVYVYVKYVGGGALVSEFERNLGLLDDVLKYQTVLVRKDVDLGALEVNTENLKFEAVEPPAEDEPEESIERQLGLVDSPDRDRHRDARDPDDEFGDVDGPVSDEDDAQ